MYREDLPLLIVEDSPEDLETIVRLLSRLPFCPPLIACADGDEALDYLFRTGRYAAPGGNGRPALILLDLNLPGTDGREVLAEIKADAALRVTPVVILTTSDNPRDIHTCYLRGASSYLVKSLDLEVFAHTLRLFVEYWFGVNLLPVPQSPR